MEWSLINQLKFHRKWIVREHLLWTNMTWQRRQQRLFLQMAPFPKFRPFVFQMILGPVLVRNTAIYCLTLSLLRWEVPEDHKWLGDAGYSLFVNLGQCDLWGSAFSLPLTEWNASQSTLENQQHRVENPACMSWEVATAVGGFLKWNSEVKMSVALAASFCLDVIATCIMQALLVSHQLTASLFNGAHSHPTQHCLGRPGDAGYSLFVNLGQCDLWGSAFSLPSTEWNASQSTLENQQHRVENPACMSWEVATAVVGFLKWNSEVKID